MAAQSQIISVFTQIEEVVANAMVAERKATKIPTGQFPDEGCCPGIWQDASGNRAKFAVVMSRRNIAEYQTRVAELRA